MKEKILTGFKSIGRVFKNLWNDGKNGKVAIIVIALIIIGALGSETYKDEYAEVQKVNDELMATNSDLTGELEIANSELKKYEAADTYMSLTDEEKTLVDAKIEEVKNAIAEQKKAEEEKIVQEKAEKEEAERIAKEQAEVEAKAQKEAEELAKAEEERVKKEKEQKDLENSNCIAKAKQYINYTSFSRSVLIEQLEYEGYSNESATYSVDSLSIDWNEQCAKKAQQYLDYTVFSRDGLYNQLTYEGFSDEQIQYGLSKVGY